MWYKLLLLPLLMLVACTSPTPQPPTAPAERQGFVVPQVKNVVLITIDTLRGDMLSIAGGPARTPVLDQLATDGWWFENAYSTSMLTNPSHASIMTSLYPRDHGVYDNESGIPDGVRTLAAAMQQQGKRTAAVINFPHLNPEVSNLGQGFEWVIKGERRERRAPEISQLTLSTIDKLQEQSPGSGWFVWVHYTDPHAPYEPPESHPPAPLASHERTPIEKAQRAAPGFQRRNPWFEQAFKTHTFVEELTHKYVAEVEAADAGLALLVEGLRRRGMDRDTAYVITSDHGENLGEHELYFHHGGLYRPTVHVPLIVSAPGLDTRRWEDLVSTVDIAPTVLEMVAADPWRPMRGQSLFDLARTPGPFREHVFSEHMLEQQVAVRSTDATLILHRKSTRQFPSYVMKSGTEELYHRRVDPQELYIRPMEGEQAADLSRALNRYLGLGLQLSARPAIDQDRESLRALGYIE